MHQVYYIMCQHYYIMDQLHYIMCQLYYILKRKRNATLSKVAVPSFSSTNSASDN